MVQTLEFFFFFIGGIGFLLSNGVIIISTLQNRKKSPLNFQSLKNAQNKQNIRSITLNFVTY